MGTMTDSNTTAYSALADPISNHFPACDWETPHRAALRV